MKNFTNLMFVPMALAAALAASACDSADSGGDDGGDGGGGTAGTGGTGSGTGTVLQPSDTGWMDAMDVWNDVGVQGSWYPYGDQYGMGEGDAKCTTIGMHTPAECSTILTPPPPPAMGFPNVGGVMCTSGDITQVLACVGDLPSRCPTCSGCPTYDYSTMWGAGIGFDLNADKGEEGGAKHVWNPADHGVIGIEFTIDAVPLPGLRVEIPMMLTDAERAMFQLPAGSTTDSHPDGAPYWGAGGGGMYPNSPVMAGVNRVLWTDITPPRTGNYVFDTTRMLGVQFHVPASTSARGMYNFCISNVTLIRQ